MFCSNKTTEIFCKVDDFCKEFISVWEKSMISTKKRNRKFTMSVSEVMTIQNLFHLSGYREFKSFYLGYVQKFMKEYFPQNSKLQQNGRAEKAKLYAHEYFPEK